ncbi:MAG: hypothetical protein L0332_07840 [Chloroflexi bacterium]|nr:hypothetical protein [Chloroflexota bacterium]MCI0726617.1 hypothetical protein [Chloroflexota bacterium]
MTTLTINHQPFKPDPAHLIQSGGEGLVFEWGQSAVKVYHQPRPERAAKLCALLDSGLAGRLPTNVLGPCALALDGQGAVAGFQMPRLPAGARPLRQLANPTYWQSAGIETRQVVALFQDIHTTLDRLHTLRVIVGDLNDHNVFFNESDLSSSINLQSFGLSLRTKSPISNLQSYWIDVDSIQFDHYPCPVANPAFLDPALYNISDFSRRPVFTRLTDWYAYFTLLVKSLLQVHPYGGVHRTHKSLQARATAGVSILNPDVTYPQRARPLDSLSDELLHEAHLVFDQGQRHPFPAGLLDQYATSLIICRHCNLVYPAQRPGCPACRQQTPVVMPAVTQGQLDIRLLVNVDGIIVYVAILPTGRLAVVVRNGQAYRLVRVGLGGSFDEIPLFTGRAGYRFGFFGGQYLVVNPAGGRQLLVLDVSRPTPRQVGLVETATFRGEAVFATTPAYLYRIAQGAITRGSIRFGSLVEEVVATARRNQTWLWASPAGETVAGFYRFFDAHYFFVLNAAGANHEVAAPLLRAGESLVESNALFSQKEVAFLLKISHNGQQRSRVAITNQQGRLLHTFEHDAAGALYDDTVFGKALFGATLLHPTDEGVRKESEHGQTLLAGTAGFVSHGDALHAHPNGLLIQQASRLYLATDHKLPITNY